MPRNGSQAISNSFGKSEPYLILDADVDAILLEPAAD
jgi:hypothetical protein